MDISASVFEKWPQLFFDYGLFFITLVFILIVARGTGKNLQEALDKKEDAASVRYWRRMNTGIWIFTGVLVVATCAWWVVRKDIESTKAYVVRIDISDVQPTDVLEPFSDNLFYRNQDPNDPARRKDVFVAVAEKPFRLKQPLVIIHKKGTDAIDVLRYTVFVDKELLDERAAEYKLAFNTQKGKYELIPGNAMNPSRTGSIISTAFAGQAVPIPGERVKLPSQSPQQAPIRSEPDAAAALLGEKSSVYRQLEAIDALTAAAARGSPPDFFQKRPGTEETLLSYLITLSHHQDKLLAYKAQTLLQRADYLGILVKVATGKSRQSDEVDQRILASLEPADWRAVDQRMQKDTGVSPDRNSAPRSGLSPVPSATTDGTQYYGVTTWRTLSRDQASCLAKVVFRQNDVASARPDEALGFVQSRKGFAFNVATKSEAIIFADAAQRCGASTQFVYKGDPKLAQFKEE